MLLNVVHDVRQINHEHVFGISAKLTSTEEPSSSDNRVDSRPSRYGGSDHTPVVWSVTFPDVSRAVTGREFVLELPFRRVAGRKSLTNNGGTIWSDQILQERVLWHPDSHHLDKVPHEVRMDLLGGEEDAQAVVCGGAGEEIGLCATERVVRLVGSLAGWAAVPDAVAAAADQSAWVGTESALSLIAEEASRVFADEVMGVPANVVSECRRRACLHIW